MSVEIKMMELSFCSDVVHNVVNSESKEYIMNRLKTKYDVEISKKHAYILNNKSIYFLEKTQHIISIKSSGTNYYLYFTNINNINYCFYIDRKIKSGYTYPRIISVKYCFNDSVFQDTLLDGELVRDINDNDSWIFLINDILINKGQKLNCNIVNRYNILYDLLSNDYNKNHEIDICPLIVKKLFLYKDYDTLITKFIPSLPYKTNGLYFNSLNTKHANQLYLFKNTNSKEQQNKPKYKSKELLDTNTSNQSNINYIILKIKKTNKSDIYDLYCTNNNEDHNLGMACIPNLRISKLIRNMFETNNNDNIFVNCKLNDKFRKYEPISISDSKIIHDLNSLNL